jgi:hypothetical protein
VHTRKYPKAAVSPNSELFFFPFPTCSDVGTPVGCPTGGCSECGIFVGKLLGESDFNIERTVVGMLLGLSDLKTVGIPVGAFVFTKGTGAELINEFDLKFSVSSFNNSAVSILCISVCRLTFISDRKILSISD